MSEQKNQDETSVADQTKVGAESPTRGDYKVGRGRPPKNHSWKKGQSGNPSGRRKKRPSKKAILSEIMNEHIVISEDGKKRRVIKYEALCRSHLSKAIRGDARSAKWIRDEAARVGLGDDQEEGFSALPPPTTQFAQSEALFANLDRERLSDQEKIELARIGEIIDLGGDFTALSEGDFDLAKKIVNKGRGKDVTPLA